MRRMLFILFAAVLAIGYAVPMTTTAQTNEDEFSAQLGSLNGSGTNGSASITVDDGEATVELTVWGASPGLFHAQHIHINGQGVCPGPDAADDRVDDGLIDTVEGLPSYGEIGVSLTTSGDVDAGHGLAADRFPVASSDGSYTYSRTFALPDGVGAAEIDGGAIVVHGISSLFDDPNAYDGAPRSSLTDSLPLEATIPAACGPIFGEAQLDDIEEQQEEATEAAEEEQEAADEVAEEEADAAAEEQEQAAEEQEELEEQLQEEQEALEEERQQAAEEERERQEQQQEAQEELEERQEDAADELEDEEMN
jgi:hypothetical protein